MQITDLAQEEKILPIFRLGFRPFFLAGAVFSVLALLLWSLLLHGNVNLSVYGGGYFWHIHEMIFGFGCAIIVGFLLTAVQNWTGIRGVSGLTLATLFIVWLLGRLTLLAPDLLGTTLTAIIDLAFLPYAAFLLAKPIVRIRQYRNLIFLPILIGFTLLNLLMHLAAAGNAINVAYIGYAAVILVTLLMSVMAGRVTPMFTANGTRTQKVEPIVWIERLCSVSIILLLLNFVFASITRLNTEVTAGLFLSAAALQFVRWLRWRPWITLSVPLLWSLHIALAFIWWGLLTLGLAYLSNDVPQNHAWHILTIGGMSGLILAMITRVSLGHTGRMLSPPKPMLVAYAAIFLSAIVRAFGPWLSPQSSLLFYDISIGFWLTAFGLFSLYYGPMLLTARVDGRPG